MVAEMAKEPKPKVPANLPSGEPKTVSEGILRDVQNDILSLQRHLAQSDSRIERIARANRLDEKEFAVGKLQSERAILDAVSELARTVDALVHKEGMTKEERVEAEGQALFQANREHRSQVTRHNLNHIRYLSSLNQERTYVCPCGEHMGIKLTAPDGRVVEENLCPRHWYIKQARLALANGVKNWTTENPLDKYLEQYKLGGE